MYILIFSLITTHGSQMSFISVAQGQEKTLVCFMTGHFFIENGLYTKSIRILQTSQT